ncbi:MAG: cysteine desulfurase [Oscillospiraceae bacterium]|nr:cysteine desulfurase [Oscillospiraceae bacterium]
MIYFDNAASTKPADEATAAFNAVISSHYANASSLHKGGIEAEKIITAAKKTILSRLPSGGDLIFTSGGTESNNLAVLGIPQPRSYEQCKIITTALEHPSVAEPVGELEKRCFSEGSSASVLRLSPAKGQSFEDRIISAVDKDVFFLSVMAVNNETGFIIDTPKIYDAVKRKFPNCIVHTDAVQGFLKVPVDGDLISLSAHKIHGLKGVGGLFVREKVRINPQIRGGGQQGGLRSGTEPTELIAAFGAAVENYSYSRTHFIELSERLSQLLEGFDGVNFKLNSRDNLPSIINFSVKGVKSEILLHELAQNGIYVSSGSACARNKKSKALIAFGVSEKDADSAIRLSFSHENTTEEAEKFALTLKAAVSRFRR